MMGPNPPLILWWLILYTSPPSGASPSASEGAGLRLPVVRFLFLDDVSALIVIAL